MIDYQVSCCLGIPEQYRSTAVDLYDEAFGKKFSFAVRRTDSRKALFRQGFTLKHGIGAITDGQLLGIAGLHSKEGSLTGGITYADLVSQLGWLRGNKAALIFSLYQRKPEPDELVMDGIAVSEKARGTGIGSQLLNEVKQYAQQNGYNRIRLDVIDTNPKAKRLYERMGFQAMKTDYFPYLKTILGFGGVTTMSLRV